MIYFVLFSVCVCVFVCVVSVCVYFFSPRFPSFIPCLYFFIELCHLLCTIQLNLVNRRNVYYHEMIVVIRTNRPIYRNIDHFKILITKCCSESANRLYHKPRDPSYFYVAFAEKLLNFYSPIPAKWKMHKHWLVCQNNQLTGKYLGLVFIKTFKLQKPSVSYTIICLVLAKFPHPAWMFFFPNNNL